MSAWPQLITTKWILLMSFVIGGPIFSSSPALTQTIDEYRAITAYHYFQTALRTSEYQPDYSRLLWLGAPSIGVGVFGLAEVAVNGAREKRIADAKLSRASLKRNFTQTDTLSTWEKEDRKKEFSIAKMTNAISLSFPTRVGKVALPLANIMVGTAHVVFALTKNGEAKDELDTLISDLVLTETLGDGTAGPIFLKSVDEFDYFLNLDKEDAMYYILSSPVLKHHLAEACAQIPKCVSNADIAARVDQINDEPAKVTHENKGAYLAVQANRISRPPQYWCEASLLKL